MLSNIARFVSLENSIWFLGLRLISIDSDQTCQDCIRGLGYVYVCECLRVCVWVVWVKQLELKKNWINFYFLFIAFHGHWVWHIEISHTLHICTLKTYRIFRHFHWTYSSHHTSLLYICRSTGLDGGEVYLFGTRCVIYYFPLISIIVRWLLILFFYLHYL